MAKLYKLTKSEKMVIKSGVITVPVDPQNRDGFEYLQWLAEGNTPDPVDPEPNREQEQRGDAINQIEQLQKDLALSTTQPEQNSLRREISRLKYISQGV